MKRDGSSEEEASARIASQMSIADKVQHADYPIDNSGTVEQLTSKVDEVIQQLETSVGRFWWRLDWLCPPFGVFSALWTLALRSLYRSKRSKTF
jgi:dephospho-CoA kinase